MDNFCITDDQKIFFDDQGYLLFEGVISNEEIILLKKKLNNTYDKLKINNKNIYSGELGVNEKLILNLHNKDKSFIKLLTNETILPMIEYGIQKGSYKNKEKYIVSQFTGRDPNVNVPEQQLHVDSRFPGAPFPLSIIALWMLDDFNKNTGATRLVPGSHLFPEYPKDGHKYKEEIQINAKAGSVLIYNAGLWHGGGKKLKDLSRWGIIITYSRWFLKQAFDMTKNTSDEIYQTLTEKEKELFGFSSVPPHDENVRAKTIISPENLPKSIK